MNDSNKKLLFSSETWCELTGIIVLDPDGWNRDCSVDEQAFDKDWNKLIDFETFIEKCGWSTTNGLNGKPDVCKLNVVKNLIDLI